MSLGPRLFVFCLTAVSVHLEREESMPRVLELSVGGRLVAVACLALEGVYFGALLEEERKLVECGSLREKWLVEGRRVSFPNHRRVHIQILYGHDDTTQCVSELRPTSLVHSTLKKKETLL